MQSKERAWAEIDLDAIVKNFHEAKKRAGNRTVYAVVKADAYGHGAVPVARALALAGAAHFAVATAQEAFQLRRHGITQPILLLGVTDARWASALADKNVELCVNSVQTARLYSKELDFPRQTAKIHIKLDSGMARLGFQGASHWQDSKREILEIMQMSCFEVVGMFTHFAAADESDGAEFTQAQYSIFEKMVQEIKEFRPEFIALHCANSAGLLAFSDTWGNAVRPGIMLYGSNPCRHLSVSLAQTMRLCARIAQIQTLKAGETVGYGRTWTAKEDCVLATVSIGYADGLLRSLSGRLCVAVNGHKCPQVGRICMDMCMIDITRAQGAQVGDTVVIFGADAPPGGRVDDVADAAGTISYEVFCAVGRRVPRFYYKGGVLQGKTCYIDEL